MNSAESLHIVIVEHLDPLNLVPGGIDSIIHDIVKFSRPETSFSIVGIATDPQIEIGKWQPIQFAGRDVRFLPVLQLDRMSHHGIARFAPHSLLFATGLMRHRRSLPAAAYHTHRIETGYLLLKLQKGPIVQFIHNDSNGLLGAGSDSIWRRAPALYRRLERSVVSDTYRTVLFNKTDSSRLAKLRSDLIVSRTWFDSDVFVPDKAGSRANDSASANDIEICWIGRIDSQKDPHLALEVLRHLTANGLRARLTMVGDGALAASVSAKARELGLDAQFDMLGAVSRAEVADVLAQSHVLLMTSRYEGSPVVLLEAGASGLPVVATEESDPDHALQTGINGERIRGRDAAALAAALLAAKDYSRPACRQIAEQRSGKSSVPMLLDQVSGGEV
ncbi:glycosyltransferase family 4 protein [Arthrobacter sp. SAFR-014]|uniref:glycosyltransferase family 4 protein n=1 Tax=unclassified Arthrobacter TaxID=235627 RepID=UPI003F7CA437